MAMEAFDPQKINRVILLLDGVANVGQTEADSILEEIHPPRRARSRRSPTIGFGMTTNDTLMEQLR
ncbi:MAG: hypothetical protein IPO22_02395 [Anaerolineales bacterium]|nr:hypothetical protein [Anaerolineales bacterium]